MPSVDVLSGALHRTSPTRRALLPVLFFAVPLFGGAQMPAATVEDGGLLVPGTFGTGSIPASGEGVRMMWYPAKAAFRVGRVIGNGSPAPCASRSDALVLDEHGDLWAAGSIESQSGGFVLPDGTTLEGARDLEGLPTNGAGAFDLDNHDGHVALGAFGSG